VFAAVDVGYGESEARAACVLFEAWSDDKPREEIVETILDPAPYEPGSFYKRELPCLMRVLERARRERAELEAIVIDGYVTLDPAGKPGLGQRLHEALEGRVAIVGVAKTSFAGATHALEVRRGKSEKPLFITASGMDVKLAAAAISRMHGPSRIPTLLRRVDLLSRGAA